MSVRSFSSSSRNGRFVTSKPRPFSAHAPFYPTTTQKDLMEANIVRRRNIDREKHEFWGEAVKYYDKVERNAGKFNLWSSEEKAARSLKQYHKERNLEVRKENLLQRRERLKALLAREQTQYEEELLAAARRHRGGANSLYDLRMAKEAMRKEKEEEQMKEAKEKMEQHWKLNNPEFRELQFKKHREIVQKAWEEQKEEKERKKQLEKQQEMELMQKQIEENLKKELVAKEMEAKREKDLQDWKDTIQKQIRELQEKKIEEKRLREEVQREQEVMAKTQLVEDLQRKMEKKRKDAELGHFLKRQHILKLKMRSVQIQQELEEDRHILEEMQKINEAKFEHDQKRKENQEKELNWLRNVLAEQKKEEERREKRMNLMFSEEAENFWEKQDKIWRNEKRAREELMNDVILSWKCQIDSKIQDAQEEMRRVEEERVAIQQNIKELNSQIEREVNDIERKKSTMAKDLETQIKDRDADKSKINEAVSKISYDDTDNELAAKLANWDALEYSPHFVTDFRRKKSKWF